MPDSVKPDLRQKRIKLVVPMIFTLFFEKTFGGTELEDGVK